MLRGGVIAFTCLLSKIFLKTNVYSHHLLGIFVCIIGFVLVGLASVVSSDNESSADEKSAGGVILGIIMVAASLLVQASQFVYEEVLLSKYEVPPQRMVGIEGMFGLIFLFNWTMIFSFIKCPSNEMCDIRGYFEDPATGLHQLLTTPGIIGWSMVTVVSIMLFNNYGLVLTKSVSSVFRAFWDASRTILVWVSYSHSGCKSCVRT
jgi:drug/metabolite transporter (DMT)-like permease